MSNRIGVLQVIGVIMLYLLLRMMLLFLQEFTIDVDAFAKSISITNASLISQAGTTLTIENAAYYGFRTNDSNCNITIGGTMIINTSARNGIFNQASSSFVNNGTIYIDGTGANYAGIDSRSNFTNNGNIYIDDCNNASGILNYNSGQTFTNSASGNIYIATLGAMGYHGVDNQSIFLNQGNISIGLNGITLGRNGINNSVNGNFTNSGTLSVNNTGSSGNFSAIENVGSFQNSNSLTILSDNYRGVGNTGTFTNSSGGTLNVATTESSNIYNYSSGNFTNSGTLILNGTTTVNSPNIDNRTVLPNSATGICNIDNSAGQGIYNYSAGTFTNNGAINIGQSGNISTHGIQNDGVFENTDQISIGSASYSIGGRGIILSNTFNNNGGTINIDNTTSAALQNNGGTTSNTNGGTINIGLQKLCSHRN
ncbi:MAG: hypothetical protein R2771_10470 [Saprospiraceae bacterium]